MYKKVLKEVFEKYERAGDFINKKLDEVYSREKLSAEEVIYFLISF